MAVTLAEAMQKRKAELRGELKPDHAVKTTKHFVRGHFLKQLEIELPKDVEIYAAKGKYPDGYHVEVRLPGPDCALLLRFSESGSCETRNLERKISVTSLTLRCMPAVEEEKRLIQHCFLKWLGVESLDDTEICIKETDYPGGYCLQVKFPDAGVVSLRRTLYVHNGIVSAWPFSTDPLWRATGNWRATGKGMSEYFDDFINAALYACGEAIVDESGNLELSL